MTAACNRTACRWCRWKRPTAASAPSTNPAATRTTPAPRVSVPASCPSWAASRGKRRAKADQERLQQLIAQLPAPAPAALDRPYRLLVAGMGGTGVITIGAIISMAAHLEGLSAAVLDLTGLAQKGGTVVSHIRLAPAGASPPCGWTGSRPTPPSCATRWPRWRRTRWARCATATQVTVNTYVAPVSEFTRNPDAAMRPEALLAKIRHAAGDAHTAAIDAHAAALACSATASCRTCSCWAMPGSAAACRCRTPPSTAPSS